MFKNLRPIAMMAAAASMAFVISSCDEKVELMNESVNIETPSLLTRSSEAVSSEDGFGYYETEFLAGQSIHAGTVVIRNDFNNVYVTLKTFDGWMIGKTHLFIGPKDVLLDPANGFVNKNGSPKNGQFPYGETLDPAATEWEFVMPLMDLYETFYGDQATEFCGEKICPVVAAHAEVMKQIGTTEEGEPIFQTETAWGKGPKFVNKGNWSTYTAGFCVTFPSEEETPEYSFQTETAWAFDTENPLEYGGNWAKFIQYNGEPLQVILLAGQKETEMTVTLTPVGDKVNIVIEGIAEIAPENDGKWVLQDKADAVKIQGYEVAPVGTNPAPGQFKSYQGRDLNITVDAANFYGIHLDVAKLTVVR